MIIIDFHYNYTCNFRNTQKKGKAASNVHNEKVKAQSALYSLEELDKFNLPPLPDLDNLQIDYENEEFLHIGHVKAIVETLGKC